MPHPVSDVTRVALFQDPRRRGRRGVAVHTPPPSPADSSSYKKTTASPPKTPPILKPSAKKPPGPKCSPATWLRGSASPRRRTLPGLSEDEDGTGRDRDRQTVALEPAAARTSGARWVSDGDRTRDDRSHRPIRRLGVIQESRAERGQKE